MRRPQKNLLTLHESVAIILLHSKNRTATFEELASQIEEGKLFTERKGNIALSEQIRLRTVKGRNAKRDWFEPVGDQSIRLRNI